MITRRVEHNRRLTRVDVDICQGPFERARGLLLRRPLDDRSALLLERCRSIHTCGMRYAIDVLFCDDRGTILQIVESLPPWRFAQDPHAQNVWELRAGTARRMGLRTGDRLRPC